ncbi:MAG: hypothetical protein A2076_06020 [Geobacteraceae bacterium GWC2_53_11]|nr:MAG: hypothetical protein A2076_06020 [Geobacteraceae bacterium GWC2_53_11]
MKKLTHDLRQLTLDELFEIPKPVEPIPASLDTGKEIRHLLSAALKETTKSRYEVCARMSELTGHEISISMLNAWTAESRESWRFPLEYTVPNHSQNGKNYTVNKLATVKDEINKITGTYLVYGRTLNFDKQSGSTTTLRLGPPGLIE